MGDQPLKIRQAGPQDWEAVSQSVLELLRELGDEADDLGTFDAARFRAEWESNPELMRALVAYDASDTVCGIATLAESFAIYANGRYGILLEMYVAPSARNAGVGAALLREVEQLARARGWSRIEVTAPESNNARTVAFYERNGFEFAGPKLKKPL